MALTREGEINPPDNNAASKGQFKPVVTHESGFGKRNYPLPHLAEGRTRPAAGAQTADPQIGI